jgi:PAS domain S-box-containing protein
MSEQAIKVLLIEDNPGDAALVGNLLDDFAPGRFALVVAPRLSDAQDQLDRQHFDAVMADLSLPDSTGLETLDRVKAAAPRLPLIVMSGLDDEALALQAVHHGAQDYLVKGTSDGHVIARVIRYAIERQGIEEELRRAHDLLEQRVMERTAFLKVTNRRLHEEIAERQRTEEVLRKERDFSAAILDTVGALVVVLDTEGRIVRFNRCCEQTTGYLEAEIKGRYVWDIFLEPTEIGDVRPVFRELLARKVGNKYENHWLTRDGRKRLINWSNTVIVDARGEVEHVIATGIDITERRQAEELQHQRMLELAHVSRLSTMGQMATEIAHELNQPLAAIASYADTCKRMHDAGNCDPADVQHVLREIAVQAERAGDVIRRIRRFVRKEEAERVEVDLGELVTDVVRLTQVEARWNKVTVRTNVQVALPAVRVDKILIEQVVLNLVRNAIEAIASADGHDRDVEIATRLHEDGAVEVAVHDTGPGLPPQIIDKIFQPFFTTKPQGMGMGLSLSQSIAVAHGGKLRAEPRAGHGTTFRLILPAQTTEGQNDAARSHRIHRR